MMRVFYGAVATVLLLAACSSGDANADGNLQRFCELIEQYNKGTGFQAPPEDTPEDEQAAALSAALRDYLKLPEIQAVFDELGEVAPSEVADAVKVMRETSDHLVETGESKFEEEGPQAANEQIIAFTEAGCAPDEAPQDDGDGDGQANPTENEAATEGEQTADENG